MTDLNRNKQPHSSQDDLSRARKRKQKMENRANSSIASQTESHKPAVRRASRRSGPSTRERIVADQIKAHSEAFPSIQGKLASRVAPGNEHSQSEKSSRRTRRETEPRRNATAFEATPRAETQRITGSEHGNLPYKNRRVYNARSEAAPPVMVRGGMGGMAFGRVATSRLPKQRTPKRRIDLPLRVTGAEIRLPSIPFLNLGWRSVSLMMVIMMSACLILMWQASIFKVGMVDAQGLKRLTANDLSAVMGTYGKSIFSLDPQSLNETLSQAFPELSRISVRINLPASVRVVATERQPVISWTQDGVDAWVDADGVSFPVRGQVDSPLVQVEGYGNPPGVDSAASPDAQTKSSGPAPLPGTPNNPSLRLSSELVSAILALGAKMPADTVLVYDSQHGLGWNDPNGWDVFFGDENQDMDMKLAVYQALVERLKSDGIQPALISVEYVHAPYYRMER